MSRTGLGCYKLNGVTRSHGLSAQVPMGTLPYGAVKLWILNINGASLLFAVDLGKIEAASTLFNLSAVQGVTPPWAPLVEGRTISRTPE